jgi:RsiW-degrading membrane proteinase PrsW (M82 family)
MNNNELLKSLNAKQKKSEVVVSKTTTTTSEVIKLKATKWDYLTTLFLVLMIVAAVVFIIWTRKGYADNFTEQFQSWVEIGLRV